MIFYLAAYIAVCLYGVKFCGKSFNDGYISRAGTEPVKGIFVIMILFSHFLNSYSSFGGTDLYVRKFISFFGQLMVTMFLFYSGYGIMESVKKKGGNYVINLPVQRILKLLADFDIAVIIYVVLGLISGSRYSWQKIILSLVGWDSVGNSNWYIFAILCLYAASFLAFLVCKDRYCAGAAAVTVLCAFYMFVLRNFKEPHWYNTAVCYVLGVWYSVFRTRIEKIVMKNNLTWALSLVVCCGLFAVCHHFKNNFAAYELHAVFFVLAAVAATMKIKIGNPVLAKAGSLVFGVYILQRIPMKLLALFGILENHMYVSFAVTAAVTVLLAMGYVRVTKFTGKLFGKAAIRKR